MLDHAWSGLLFFDKGLTVSDSQNLKGFIKWYIELLGPVIGVKKCCCPAFYLVLFLAAKNMPFSVRQDKQAK